MAPIPAPVMALLAALRFRDALCEALQELSEAEWDRVLSFCDSTHLTIPLSQSCRENLPDWVQARIARNISDNRERFKRIQTVYTEMAKTLDAAGVEHLVLKGFAQWPAEVQDPALRQQSDIDLYCPAESGNDAIRALSTIGYKPIPWTVHFPSDQHLPTMMRPNTYQWRGNFFDPEMPLSVDVHIRFWNPETTHIKLNGLEQFWTRRIEKKIGDMVVRALHPVDSLGYCTLHALRNLITSSATVHQTYELGRFLDMHSGDREFWTQWKEWHDDSLRQVEATFFSLAREWFHCRMAEEVEQEIHRLPSGVQRWLEEYAYSPIRSILVSNKDALWLHLSLVESWRDQWSIFRQRLLGARMPPVAAFEENASESDRARRAPSNPGSRLRKHARHFAYVASRAAYHMRTFPSTLIRGLRWWWSGEVVKRLRRPAARQREQS